MTDAPPPVFRAGDQVGTTLRPATAHDRPFLLSLARDARVTRYIGDGRPWSEEVLDAKFTQALTGAPWSAPGGASWFIAVDADGRHIGLLSVRDDEDAVEIGYWVHPDQWGKGHATRLVRLARELVGASPNGLQMRAHVHEDNVASRRALEACGFRRRQAAGSDAAAGQVEPALDPRTGPLLLYRSGPW